MSFDLLILKSWDGNSPAYGPDRWSLAVTGGPTLLATTFSNNPKVAGEGSHQDYPKPQSAPRTGAVSIGTLGYNDYEPPVHKQHGQSLQQKLLAALPKGTPFPKRTAAIREDAKLDADGNLAFADWNAFDAHTILATAVPQLGVSYEIEASNTAKHRVALAGRRLGDVLKQLF